MSPAAIVAAELALVFGVVLGLAVWELLRLRRDRATGKPAAQAPMPD
jgi:hypothetical protein